MIRTDLYSARWNNIIALGLGIPAHALMVFLIIDPPMSAKAAFWVIQVVGAFY